MRELWATIAKTSGARVYSMAVGVLTLFLTARLLGPEGRGTVAAITTWVGMFCTFSHLSLGQVALHRMSESFGKTRYGILLASLLLLTGVITVLSWASALVLGTLKEDGAFRGLPMLGLIIGFASLPFMIWEQYSSSLLMALERLQTYNRFQVIGRTLGVISIFFFVAALGTGVSGVLVSNLLAQAVVAAGGLGFLFAEAKRRGEQVTPGKAEIRSLIDGGLKLHLNAVGTFLFTSASILMLNHYRGAAETGYYQFAVQLVGVIMIIPQAASMVVFGKIVSLGPDRAWPTNRRILLQTTSIMIFLCIVAGVTAPWWTLALAGEAFRPAISIFRWLLLGVVGMTFSTIMGPQWIGRGYFLMAAGLTFLVGIINLVTNFYFIPLFGMMGAVYSFLGTFLVSILGNGAMAIFCNRAK